MVLSQSHRDNIAKKTFKELSQIATGSNFLLFLENTAASYLKFCSLERNKNKKEIGQETIFGWLKTVFGISKDLKYSKKRTFR